MSTNDIVFSPAETRLLLICFKHMEGTPNIDFDKVATEYGYKSGNLARSKFQLAKNKHKTIEGSTDVTNPADGPKTNKGTAAKRKATGEGMVGGAKRGRKPKIAAMASTQDSEEGNDKEGPLDQLQEQTIKVEYEDAENSEEQKVMKLSDEEA